MHIVPAIDDGARTTEEALQMLKMAEAQGVTDVFCTSHNGYTKEDGERHIKAFEQLKTEVKETDINISLHKGCEILCAKEYIDDIIYGLDIGAFSTLGNTNYVLAELYPDARPSEALYIIDALNKNGYKAIIAHMERNFNITGLMVNTLITAGANIQVNAHSFVDETDNEIKSRARQLLKKRYIHFIGSDSHRIDHRPPELLNGINYIFDNTDKEYANKLLYENAMSTLLKN